MLGLRVPGARCGSPGLLRTLSPAFLPVLKKAGSLGLAQTSDPKSLGSGA